MISADEFWEKCNVVYEGLVKKGRSAYSPFTQTCSIIYTALRLIKEGSRMNERVDDNDGNICVRGKELGKPNDDGRRCVRMQKSCESVQEEARGEQTDQVGQGSEGGEKSKKEEQEVSDLCHMRKMERGRVLYCLDYIMRSLNDEEAQAPWLEEGCEDGLITDILTEDQVEDHAGLVESQQQLDEFVALAARILFSEVYPKAWQFLQDQFEHKLKDLMEPERCVLA